MIEKGDPDRDGEDMQRLIQPDHDDLGIGRFAAAFEVADPPVERDAGVDQQVNQAEDQTRGPAQGDGEANEMDDGMDPGGGMPEAGFMGCHPIILQDPIRDQVCHQAFFKGSKH